MIVPPKLAPGDRVAVVSRSFAAPALFPAVHELGVRRLRAELDLVPVEYPTTRQLGASPQERATDLMSAFADPTIRAVLATIGGDDQLTVLPSLDPEVVLADPKPFVGFSDNTNLLNWLWHLGIAGYHGGSTTMHLGRGGAVHPVSIGSLRAALMAGGDIDLHEVDTFSEDELDWADPGSLDREPLTQPSPGWSWHHPDRVVTGPTWGAATWRSCTGTWPPTQFPAVIVGRAKASSFDLLPPGERVTYRAEQREAILAAMSSYHPDAVIVFGVDIGHTDPQWVLPYGGTVTVDGPARRIIAHYGPRIIITDANAAPS